jgi:hypothetical protein
MRMLLGSAAIVCALFPSSITAQVIIDNGTVQIGVNPAGNLVTDGVGLTFLPSLTNPDAEFRGEALAPGCSCEGWGLGDLATGSYAMAGEDFGFNGILNSSVTASGTGNAVGSVGSSAVSITEIREAELNVLLTHTFAPSVSQYLYSVRVDILNQGGAEIGNLVYRRAMDWDVPPDEFNEYVTLQGWPATALIGTSNDGFASGNINEPLDSILDGVPVNANFTNAGPSDHGAAFDFSFGTLAVGATEDITIFYGAAPSEADAILALSAVRAEVYSLGKVGSDAGRDLGTPHTFIFGFAGVGGTPLGSDAALAPINQFPQMAQVFVGQIRGEVSARMSDAGFSDMLAAGGLISPEVDRGRRKINYHFGVFTGSGSFDGTTNNASLDYRRSGLSFALDTNIDSGISGFEKALVGAQITLSDASSVDVGEGEASLDAQAIDFALYGRLTGSSNLFAEGILNFGRYDYSQDRVGMTDVFSSDPEGQSLGALVRIGQTQALPAGTGLASSVSWYGEFASNRTKIDDFTENNNGLLTASYSDTQTNAGVGVRYETAWQSGSRLSYARIDLAGLVALDASDYSAAQFTTGGAGLLAVADGVDTRALRLRGTLGMVQSDNLTASIDLSGLYDKGEFNDQQITARLKLEF